MRWNRSPGGFFPLFFLTAGVGVDEPLVEVSAAARLTSAMAVATAAPSVSIFRFLATRCSSEPSPDSWAETGAGLERFLEAFGFSSSSSSLELESLLESLLLESSELELELLSLLDSDAFSDSVLLESLSGFGVAFFFTSFFLAGGDLILEPTSLDSSSDSEPELELSELESSELEELSEDEDADADVGGAGFASALVVDAAGAGVSESESESESDSEDEDEDEEAAALVAATLAFLSDLTELAELEDDELEEESESELESESEDDSELSAAPDGAL